MRKERFLKKRHSKLLAMVDGHFKIIENSEENAQKLEFPDNYDISVAFSVKDIGWKVSTYLLRY